MSKRVEIYVDVYSEEQAEKAEVLKTLTAHDLIREIVEEFGEEDDLPTFELTKEATGDVLILSQTLVDQGVEDGDTIVFGRKQSTTGRLPLSGSKPGKLTDVTTGQSYLFDWQPAILGRGDISVKSELLAADLKNQRISRAHAQITELNGEWFIELLAERNRLAVNEEVVLLGDKHPLAHGDMIVFGRNVVKLKFSSR